MSYLYSIVKYHYSIVHYLHAGAHTHTEMEREAEAQRERVSGGNAIFLRYLIFGHFLIEHIFFFFYFIFKLYIIVLVLPNIKMNLPQVYMCSPS